MFGYLAMQSYFQTYKMHRCYANYYCGTCFGLQKNYGEISRLFLSNDVTLLGILIKCHENPLQERYGCYGNCKEKHCTFHGGAWNQMAAINLLLVNEKIKDDINDENSWKAKIAARFLKKYFQKCENQFPKMAEAIAAGYKEMYRLEKMGSSVRAIEDSFADMMVNTLLECRKLEEWEVLYIRCISKWIYYIDALDDYEEDFNSKKFNSLHKKDAPTRDEYTKKYIRTIMDDLEYIYCDVNQIVEMMPKETKEEKLLQTLICQDIPLRTARVLSGKKLSKLKIGSVWEETYRGYEKKNIYHRGI